MKVCIASIHMPNIPRAVVRAQRKVVEQFNRHQYPFTQVQAPLSDIDNHGDALNAFMELNSKQLGFEVIIFLDIDCLPLSEKTFPYLAQQAEAGYLVGNIQRSNHLENDEHLFVAPSLLGISMETYHQLGSPSFRETERGDVCEELTYQAEARGVPVEMFLPRAFDHAPSNAPFWPLKTGMPVYGGGTTYGHPELGDLSWHLFEIRLPGNEQRFLAKCEQLLKA